MKSWRIDAFLPIARTTYKAIENLLRVSIWQEKVLFRTIKSVEEENQWLLRSSYEDYLPYCSDKILTIHSSEGEIEEQMKLEKWGKRIAILQKHSSLGMIKQAAQVNVPALIVHFKQYLLSSNAYFKDFFSYNDLKIGINEVYYKNYTADKIIFCEGAKAVENPYFNWLPFNPDKGELLIVKIPGLNLSQLFKHHITIVPLGDNLYWVGATNDWNFLDDKPCEENKQLIIRELQEILNIPFEIVSHQAAIRPTVKDRRPFIGIHPDYPSLGIFNGFGTKGASLIPYWADNFTDILSQSTIAESNHEREDDISNNIDREVNISRYFKHLKNNHRIF